MSFWSCGAPSDSSLPPCFPCKPSMNARAGLVAVLAFGVILCALLICPSSLPFMPLGFCRTEPHSGDSDTIDGQTQGHARHLADLSDLLSIITLKSQTLVLAAVFAIARRLKPAQAQHDMSHMPAMRPVALRSGFRCRAWVRNVVASRFVADARRTSSRVGDWSLMLHGAVFGQYDHQNGFRRETQLGLIDWEMLMAMRPLAGGLFRVNVMTSFEPLVLGPTGYPQLLQTGGTYQGRAAGESPASARSRQRARRGL